MGIYRNILCATDFSDHCRVAAERAAELARLYGARLTLLHVVEHFPVNRSDVAPEDVDPEHYQEARAQGLLAEVAKRLDFEHVDRKVRFSMQSAQHEILRYAGKHEPDLIVIASHGRHGVSTILGSTTYGVTHNSPCDVLSVRAGSP